MQFAVSRRSQIDDPPSYTNNHGFTLIELLVATAILVILTGMAIPMARVTIKRKRDLHHALWEMRDAIDRYKDAADRGAFQIKVGSEGYPPDLDTLVNGVDVSGKKLKFLRRIPIDPMTGGTEWGMRSMQDDPTSDSWDGENVFDVFTKSQGTALDGTKLIGNGIEVEHLSRPSARGFTLLELMIVISMILILVSVRCQTTLDQTGAGIGIAPKSFYPARLDLSIHAG